MAVYQSSASHDALLGRARLLAAIRGFFAQRQVMEVETPVLSAAGNSDPAIAQFHTAGPQPRYLRSSPEYAMKRLLASGVGDCYELGRVFRAGEAGRQHNPEFTLLEWYRVGWGYQRLMDECAELVRDCGRLFGHQWVVQRCSYDEFLHSRTGLHADSEHEALIQGLTRLDINISDAGTLPRDTLLDLLISHAAQPALPAGTITLVYDYPASQAALARIKPGHPHLAERFELFLGPVELANGYGELTNAAEQRQRFLAENQRREQAGQPTVPLDEHLLAALEAGLPACSGVALGVDRLLTGCLGVTSLSEVLAFPADRA
jgi:lysyl-tRNA synthetase class 2